MPKRWIVNLRIGVVCGMTHVRSGFGCWMHSIQSM